MCSTLTHLNVHIDFLFRFFFLFVWTGDNGIPSVWYGFTLGQYPENYFWCEGNGGMYVVVVVSMHTWKLRPTATAAEALTSSVQVYIWKIIRYLTKWKLEKCNPNWYAVCNNIFSLEKWTEKKNENNPNISNTIYLLDTQNLFSIQYEKLSLHFISFFF